MQKGQSATLEFTVGNDDTPAAVGSGDLRVLGTPRLLAWCEAATVAAIGSALTEQQTSVGTRVTLEHLAASPVGERVGVTASVVYVDGRLVRFEVVAERGTVQGAEQGAEQQIVAHGEVTRVVVDRERFMTRVRPGER